MQVERVIVIYAEIVWNLIKFWKISFNYFSENKFSQNRSADWAEILYEKNPKKKLSNETNPKVFDQLEKKLWFSKDLSIST